MMMDGVPQALFREGVVEVTSSWVRFGVHPCRALHCTLFCTREISFRTGSSVAPCKEQNKCVCRLLIHLSSDVSALSCSALTSVGVWMRIHCLFVPLTLVDSKPELPSVITLSCLCKYRLSLKEKQMHLSNIPSEKWGCRFQEKMLSENAWL